jgi:hypothetical protein
MCLLIDCSADIMYKIHVIAMHMSTIERSELHWKSFYFVLSVSAETVCKSKDIDCMQRCSVPLQGCNDETGL